MKDWSSLVVLKANWWHLQYSVCNRNRNISNLIQTHNTNTPGLKTSICAIIPHKYTWSRSKTVCWQSTIPTPSWKKQSNYLTRGNAPTTRVFHNYSLLSLCLTSRPQRQSIDRSIRSRIANSLGTRDIYGANGR